MQPTFSLNHRDARPASHLDWPPNPCLALPCPPGQGPGWPSPVFHNVCRLPDCQGGSPLTTTNCQLASVILEAENILCRVVVSCSVLSNALFCLHSRSRKEGTVWAKSHASLSAAEPPSSLVEAKIIQRCSVSILVPSAHGGSCTRLHLSPNLEMKHRCSDESLGLDAFICTSIRIYFMPRSCQFSLYHNGF